MKICSKTLQAFVKPGIILGVVMAAAGCESSPGSASVARPSVRGVGGLGDVSKTPPSANVSRMDAWRDAEALSARDSGRASAVGSGSSMAPVYGENTMLVISKIDYSELEPGMTVAYASERGRQVVHQLVDLTPSGWRVQGLNNGAEDRDRVTRQNLIGVVYASLNSEIP